MLLYLVSKTAMHGGIVLIVVDMKIPKSSENKVQSSQDEKKKLLLRDDGEVSSGVIP